MSADGTIVVANFLFPYWATFTDSTIEEGDSFVSDGFEADQLVPVLSNDGRFVALTGERSVDGEVAYELWVQDTSGDRADQVIALPCAAVACEFDIGAISSSDEGTVFINGYTLASDALGAARTGDVHARVSLADASISSLAIPVSVVSPNGRYVTGLGTDSETFAASSSEFVVVDLDSGRERSFAADLLDGFPLELVGLSDDGRTVR